MQPPTGATAAPAGKATFPPSPTPVPAPTVRPDEPTAKVNGPSSVIVAQRAPTPLPTTIVNTGEQHPQAAQSGAQMLERPSEQGTTVAVATPGPTQEPIETHQGAVDQVDPIDAFKTVQSASNDLITDNGTTSSVVIWSFKGTTWSPSRQLQR